MKTSLITDPQQEQVNVRYTTALAHASADAGFEGRNKAFAGAQAADGVLIVGDCVSAGCEENTNTSESEKMLKRPIRIRELRIPSYANFSGSVNICRSARYRMVGRYLEEALS